MRLAVKHVTHEHTAMLQSLIADMEESRSEFELWAERNFAFHNAICSIAEMPRVREMTVRVFTEWERMRKHLFRGVPTPDLDQAHKEHVNMVDALRKHDLERLERLTRAHNTSALKSYLRLAERRTVPVTVEKV
jgi:DNA-binding GntR family transcriptional regulator